MDKAVLVMFPRQAGKKLLSALASPENGNPVFDVQGAFWLYRPEPDDWRLYIASPTADALGSLESYKRVQKTLSAIDATEDMAWTELSLSNISMIGMKHKLYRAIKNIALPGAHDVRVRGGSIDDFSLDEVYVYQI